MLDNSNPVIADAPIPSTTAPIQQNYNSTYSTNGTGQDTQQQEQSHLADDEEANISPHQRISLRSVARAVEWMLNIRNSPAAPKSSETNRDQDQQQDQDGSSPEPNTKKKQRNRRKPRPPRPTISKTRLKVFVGTWNMMGQMPDIHDGLTGFIDISQKDSNRASHLKTSATDTRSSGQEQRPHMISPSASAPHICTPASTAASSTSTGLQLNLEVSAEAPHPKKRGGLLERIRCTGRSRKGELQPSVSVGHLPIQQQPSPSSPAGHAPGILKEPYLEMNTGPPYHIIAINTQECEREIREAVLFPSKIVWEKRLQAYLGPDYVMIKTETMAALHIAVFIWRPIEDLVSAVDSSTVATGIGGIVGNKGAVAISIYLGSMSLLFVNAHLTAHQSNTHARNSDYKRIIHELQLNDAPKSSPGRWYFKGDMQLRRHYNSPPALARQKSSHFGNNGKGSDDKKPIGKSSNGDLVEKKPGKTSHLKINTELAATEQHSHRQEGADENGPAKTEINVDITEQFDYTFWAGDLNYRVDLSRAQAEKCLEKEDLGVISCGISCIQSFCL
ncbi:Endonuclease/exonuclease/phosphatase [Gamsiella multidivaricata]|uniref:Endonuclease/exonuclease/phosphatase n=1 Tax=Gamsiella multidivaricata TaxID=101098 RepID=UPI00221E752C|nr:Endonuclease/exonuclease/phosphatase [Gamsiella multidivaricata]KAI7831583.1 Endonuclease/exonuclease/phosphatase [Gamsiella multidivaricata]